jgi:hypothetical protein
MVMVVMVVVMVVAVVMVMVVMVMVGGDGDGGDGDCGVRSFVRGTFRGHEIREHPSAWGTSDEKIFRTRGQSNETPVVGTIHGNQSHEHHELYGFERSQHVRGRHEFRAHPRVCMEHEGMRTDA